MIYAAILIYRVPRVYKNCDSNTSVSYSGIINGRSSGVWKDASLGVAGCLILLSLPQPSGAVPLRALIMRNGILYTDLKRTASRCS